MNILCEECGCIIDDEYCEYCQPNRKALRQHLDALHEKVEDLQSQEEFQNDLGISLLNTLTKHVQDIESAMKKEGYL